MKKWFLVILISLVSFSSFAGFKEIKLHVKKLHQNKRGGGMDGGGTGGMREEEGAAWFYQDHGAISVCYKISPTFKASENEIRSTIQESFKTWSDYVEAKGLYSEYYDDDDNEIPYPNYLKIAHEIKFETCSKDTELTFYFGVEDQRIKDIKEGLHNPKGFAFRDYKDIDAIKGTSKGVVWIFNPLDTPEPYDDYIFKWEDKEYLQTIVNHEVGHIFGAHHEDDTIMRESLESLFSIASVDLSQSPPVSQATKELVLKYRSYLSKIDHGATLAQSGNTYDYQGKIGITGSSEEQMTFKKFFNRAPIGDVSAEFKGQGQNFELIIADDKERKSFVIKEFDNSLLTGSNGKNQFKRVRKVYDPDWDEYDYEIETHFQFVVSMLGRGKINNQEFTFQLSLGPQYFGYFDKGSNETSKLGSGSFSIHYLNNGDWVPLFIESIGDYSEVIVEDSTDIDPMRVPVIKK